MKSQKEGSKGVAL